MNHSAPRRPPDLAPAAARPVPEVTLPRIPGLTALERDFPAVALSRIAEHESWRKEVYRPATSTHKWWAKRLGAVFRGILCSAVTRDGRSAMEAYASATRLDGLTVFDPFAGSGTTLVEAAKLGANVVGGDINPVATLVQRQAVQRWDVRELGRAYSMVESACRAEIDRVHRAESGETVLYYFWVAIAACPHCGETTRLFSTHVYARNAYPQRAPGAQVVCPACLDLMPGRHDFQAMTCRYGHAVGRRGAVSRGTMTCPAGHASRVLDALSGRAPRHEMYAKLVLGADGRKRYEAITDFDRRVYRECSELLGAAGPRLVLPRGQLEDGENTRQAIRWGYTTWRQFFNDRQLYSLGLLAAAIRGLPDPEPEREAMVALFSGTLEFNNMFCSFKGEGTGAVRHMFSHHILKPERTPLEAHPWGTPASSGSFSTLYRARLLRAHAYKTSPTDQVVSDEGVRRIGRISLPTEAAVTSAWPSRGLAPGLMYLRTGDSSHTDLPDRSVDLIVTDPPYMDNVHYSELADFFHAWLRELMPFPGYPADGVTTRSEADVQSAAPEEFRQGIAGVWRECRRVLRAGGLMAFTFHQARLSGWVALVLALAEAGFVVTAVQPVKAEMSTSVAKNGLEPSNLDAIVVCRERAAACDAPADPHVAADLGARRLAELQSAGIDVGPGDVRSVIRAHVLATYTAAPQTTDIQALAALADRLAAERAVRLLPG